MPRNRSLYGLFALAVALAMGFSASARAEFFGCKDDRGRVLASWTTSSAPSGPSYYGHSYSRSYTPARPRYTHAAPSWRDRYHVRRSDRW
jgi:hypothetical protein